MRLVREGFNVLSKKGLIHFLRRLPVSFYHRSIRRFLPTIGYATYNGVDVRETKLLDPYFQNEWWDTVSDWPEYENGLVTLHEKATRDGDDVVIIAGGNGVSLYWAAKHVGESGSITAYEASDQQIEIIHNVISRYDLEDRCRLYHALIAEDIGVYGSESSVDVISPAKLEDCNVLELDCEGAELAILDEMDIRPREIYVELHPHLVDYNIRDVLDRLHEMGYEIHQTVGHNGMELTDSQFTEMLEYDRQEKNNMLSFGGMHPPIVWARNIQKDTGN